MAKPTIDKLPNGLGTVIKEQHNINVRFWDINIPLTSSTGRISANVLGKIRTIIVQGTCDGSDYSGSDVDDKLADFVYEVEVWVNNSGIQQKGTYTDSMGTSYTVDAVDWQWTRSNTNPNRIIYTLLMKES